MPNRTPLTARVTLALMDARMLIHGLFVADGEISDDERLALAALDHATMDAEEADNARIEAIYALNHGLEEAPTAWHQRKRRELRRLHQTTPTGSAVEVE